jgi:Tfp pilus assembly protein PilF
MSKNPMLLLPTSPLRRSLCLLALVFLCSACASSSVKEADTPPATKTREGKEAAKGVTVAPLDKAQQELASGIASYENSNYKLATRQLQSALALGLKARDEQANAHKYLAFMHCVSGRERQCREEFRMALDADPTFDLTPAETGHPTWGPVFRKLKTSYKPASK